MSEVVGEAGGVDDVRIQPEAHREFTADLGDLERMCEPVAGEVEAGGRAQHLRLLREPAQGARVHNTGAIAGEIAAAGGVLLGESALQIRRAVAGRGRELSHRSCPARLR